MRCERRTEMGIMKYFWQLYYRLRPVTGRTSKTAYLKAACRMHGVKVVNVRPLREKITDWKPDVGLVNDACHRSLETRFGPKICAEATCNHVYTPDRTGKCPKCGSQGLWIRHTVLGTNRT